MHDTELHFCVVEQKAALSKCAVAENKFVTDSALTCLTANTKNARVWR